MIEFLRCFQISNFCTFLPRRFASTGLSLLIILKAVVFSFVNVVKFSGFRWSGSLSSSSTLYNLPSSKSLSPWSLALWVEELYAAFKTGKNFFHFWSISLWRSSTTVIPCCLNLSFFCSTSCLSLKQRNLTSIGLTYLVFF